MKTRLHLLLPVAAATLCLGFTSRLTAQAASPPADDDGTAQAEAPQQMLKLRSGDILWGSIAGHTVDHLAFRRLDTGGTLQLPWGFLDPAEENRLRLRFGYVESEVEELTILADRYVLADGSEWIGIVEERTENELVLENAEGRFYLPKALLSGGATRVRVPALEVYTKETLFQRKADELRVALGSEGIVAVRANDELAQYAERLYHYAYAARHYQRVAELDPTYEPDRIQPAIERASTKALYQEQVDFLAEIDLLRARKLFGKAKLGLQRFADMFPDSPLLEDWNDLRSKVAKYEERFVREEVVREWHKWTVRLATEAPSKHTSYEAVLSYLEEQMGIEIADAVAQAVQQSLDKGVRDERDGETRKVLERPAIKPDEVRKLWEERTGGRFRQASYGLGTWLLGEERAQAVLARPDDEEKPEETFAQGTAAAERKRLEERIQRYVKNVELARKGGSSAGAGDEDPEEFWSRWTSAGRRQWVLAYYVENSGDFTDLRERLSHCRECGGTGTRTILFTGSARAGDQGAQDTTIPCPTCHLVQVVRRIRYR